MLFVKITVFHSFHYFFITLFEMSYSIGIDFGTYFSSFCLYNNGKFWEFYNGEDSIASYIEYRNNNIVVGEPVRRLFFHQGRFAVRNFKKVIGLPCNNDFVRENPDICNMPMSRAEDGTIQFLDKNTGKVYTTIEIMALLIKAIIGKVQELTNSDVDRVVLTVPIEFGIQQRIAYERALHDAGLDDNQYRLLNEPTAAAISALYHDIKQDENFIVIDIASSCRCTVFQFKNNHLRIVSHDNLNTVSVDSFIHLLMKFFIHKCEEMGYFILPDPSYPSYKRKFYRLYDMCQQAMMSLSDYYECEIDLFDLLDDDDDIFCSVSKNEFEEILRESIDMMIRFINDTISKANLTKDDISHVVLCGGASRIPIITTSIKEYFGKYIILPRNPDKMVAEGAAIVSGQWKERPSKHTLNINNQEIYIDE